MRRHALFGLVEIALAQIRAGFEVSAIDLVEQDIAPGNVVLLQQIVPPFELQQGARQRAMP
jgi:hypothetical protein